LPGERDGKTEKATAHKRKELRKKGNVFQSKEIVTAVLMLTSFGLIQLMGGFLYSHLTDTIEYYLTFGGSVTAISIKTANELLLGGMWRLMLPVLPLLLGVGLVAYFASSAQTRFIFSTHVFKPEFSKLNPVTGLKKLFSLKSLVELLKSLVKVITIGLVVYNVLMSRIDQLPGLMSMDVIQSASWIGSVIIQVAMAVGIAMLIIGILDFFYQRWEYERNIKMSKQEVKEEYKMLEGDPQVKSKIKSVQRRMAMSRMMAQVPEADVIIRNPTHYAIALKYLPEKNNAPVVLAKGKGYVAARIIKIAGEHHVEMTESPELARSLYDATEVGMEIPPDFYKAVADILAYVYELKRKIA